jgi:hypothetical protein
MSLNDIRVPIGTEAKVRADRNFDPPPHSSAVIPAQAGIQEDCGILDSGSPLRFGRNDTPSAGCSCVRGASSPYFGGQVFAGHHAVNVGPIHRITCVEYAGFCGE